MSAACDFHVEHDATLTAAARGRKGEPLLIILIRVRDYVPSASREVLNVLLEVCVAVVADVLREIVGKDQEGCAVLVVNHFADRTMRDLWRGEPHELTDAWKSLERDLSFQLDAPFDGRD